jgi:predicted GNAT family acetyltransferase
MLFVNKILYELRTMEEVKLSLNNYGRGFFRIFEGTEELGKMEIGISGSNLTVYHTEVLPKAEGRGLAKQLLNAMVSYAREHHLMVTPMCPYVHAQFKRHPDEYADIWNKKLQME